MALQTAHDNGFARQSLSTLFLSPVYTEADRAICNKILLSPENRFKIEFLPNDTNYNKRKRKYSSFIPSICAKCIRWNETNVAAGTTTSNVPVSPTLLGGSSLIWNPSGMSWVRCKKEEKKRIFVSFHHHLWHRRVLSLSLLPHLLDPITLFPLNLFCDRFSFFVRILGGEKIKIKIK